MHDNEAQAEAPGSGVVSGDEDIEVLERIARLREKVLNAGKLSSPEKAWSRFEPKIRARIFRMEWVKYAAIFVFAVALSSVLFWENGSGKFGGETLACISAPNGQIANVTLFDGTNVWLNAGSKLSYKPSFNQGEREVILEGEAYFSVKKNAKVPFIVHAGKTQIKVHGTQFDVKAYNDEPTVETVLVEGKVEFLSNGNSVMMQPGEQIRFTKSTGEVATSKVNPDDCTAWKGGKIYFDNETLYNLTRSLERWYEVRFDFKDEKIKDYRFSGVINKDRTLDYTLHMIQEINKVKFDINHEEIIVMKK